MRYSRGADKFCRKNWLWIGRLDLAVELFQDEGAGADHALLEIAVLFQHLAGEDDRHRFRHILREHGVGRLQVDADGVLVRRFHPLDFLEGE
jgi:hypothetical protein